MRREREMGILCRREELHWRIYVGDTSERRDGCVSAARVASYAAGFIANAFPWWSGCGRLTQDSGEHHDRCRVFDPLR